MTYSSRQLRVKRMKLRLANKLKGQRVPAPIEMLDLLKRGRAKRAAANTQTPAPGIVDNGGDA
jgi:hypothetical protein